MLRCDVFRNSRARTLIGKPTHVDIFDIVNGVVAEHLSTQPFTILDVQAVVRHAVDEELVTVSPRCRKRFKVSA